MANLREDSRLFSKTKCFTIWSLITLFIHIFHHHYFPLDKRRAMVAEIKAINCGLDIGMRCIPAVIWVVWPAVLGGEASRKCGKLLWRRRIGGGFWRWCFGEAGASGGCNLVVVVDVGLLLSVVSFGCRFLCRVKKKIFSKALNSCTEREPKSVRLTWPGPEAAGCGCGTLRAVKA